MKRAAALPGDARPEGNSGGPGSGCPTRRSGWPWLLGLAVGLALGLEQEVRALEGSLVISEFMAANNRSLHDEDGDSPDWIEIHNEGATTSNLGGWYLSDNPSHLAKWEFPSTNLPPNGYLVVFASEKNRRVAGAPLHTNFKLAKEGEYLALVRPGGTNAAWEYAPAFPPQADDVSYGVVRDTASEGLLNTGAVARVLVPANANLGLTWTTLEFNDSAWASGQTGVGYDRLSIPVNYLPLIGLNVGSVMTNINTTVYLRVPFVADDPSRYSGLTLRMQFEDGFIAYLNGQEIARSNAPASATWNSSALGARNDVLATNYVDFDVTAYRGFLVAGTNVLALHALNDLVNSPDLLLLPQLLGVTPNGPALARYFPIPTPGINNNAGVASLGPVVIDTAHTPAQPSAGNPLLVTASLRSALAPIASVTLHYRVMFGSEANLTMFDDGAHGDGAAGDGLYGATIPGGAAAAGQMVRWHITAADTTGTNTSRHPSFTSTNESPAYLGTVAANPVLTNALPVFHWFVGNPAAADTETGTRCSIYYDGEFYDNVFCRVRGASAGWYPKKPYKFDFNPGFHFRSQPGQPRADEVNLNSTYQDKAMVRPQLAFETYQNAGAPACDAFSVRVQQNGGFYSVAVMVEQVDEIFLDRRGLDRQGALYKMFNGLDSAVTGVEKKTRRAEDNSDLQQLVNGVNAGNPSRGTAVFDLLDLPQIINYLAAGSVAQDWDRTIKNYYLYRDTLGSGLWQVFPWDKDLTLGKAALTSDVVVGDKDGGPDLGDQEPCISHPYYGTPEKNCCGMNHLMDAIYKTPATRQMYLRRLRTLMDGLLQPPGTPPASLQYEARLNELYAALKNDAALDLARWGAGYGLVQDLAAAVGILKTNFLATHRVHLFQTHSIDNVAHYADAVGIPQAQGGSPAIGFGAIEYNPASGNQAQEYIELTSTNPAAVDVSGWRLAGAVDFAFAPGTVIPAAGRLYVSPDVAAFRARATGPRGGQGLFVVGNYRGQLSARGETLRLLDAGGAGIATNTFAGNPSPAQQFLRITEIMYHPVGPPPGDTNSAENFEFIELRNISSTVTLDLRGVHFTNGIGFSFTGSAVTNLGPGQAVLVVKNLGAFASRYGTGFLIAGEYVDSLGNAGETLRLDDGAGEKILEFAYGDGWYPITDGCGFSLVILDENALWTTWDLKASWRPSAVLNGSPGAADPAPPALPVVLVSEVLSAPLSPDPQAIEIFNAGPGAANIGGWYLTDDRGTPAKFRISPGTTVSAGDFAVFTGADFNPAPGVPPSFSLSATGGAVWLFSADPGGNLTGWLHGFEFGAAEAGVAFGRHVNSQGTEQFVAQSTNTLGGPNGRPRVGPVVISEIMYHPPDLDAGDNARDEFIELQNITAGPVPLFDALRPTNTWRLRNAVDFDFPIDVTLAPGGILLVVSFDPEVDPASLSAFRAAYGLGTNVAILGPFSGHLDNARGTLELKKPGAPEAGATPHILVESIAYSDEAPWPVPADGFGSSLQRAALAAFGDDPANWFAASRSPGSSNLLADAPLHFYRFEETSLAQPVADSGVPGGFNGAYTGGIALNQPAAPLRLGNAARFDGGPGSYVNLGLFHPGDAFTVEAWAQLAPDAPAGVWHAIVARWDGSYELDFETTDRAGFVFYTQAGQVGVLSSPAPLARGLWHHLVAAYDGNVAQLYVDGALAAWAEVPGTLRDGGPSGGWPDRVLIGATRGGDAGASYNFKGLIDEVAIYNYALPAARILARYQAALPAPVLSITAGGVVRWPAYPVDAVLQGADTLQNSGAWGQDETPRFLDGGYYQMQSPLNGGQRFYRLVKP